MNDDNTVASGPVVSTGISGLDEILGGGVTPSRVYLIEGDPGSGKTTLALQFLLQGLREGQSCLYITLSESREELIAVAESHGLSLEGIHIFELIPTEESLKPDAQYTMFHPSEVEMTEMVKAMLDQVQEHRPERVVFDSLSEMRLLAQNALRYRRQILALKQFFIGRNCTVLLLDDGTSEVTDLQLQSLAHGVITLEQLAPIFGGERRRLRVMKMRGIQYMGGFHDFRIGRGGLNVFPRLIAADHHRSFSRGRIASGIEELDNLVGGGLERGTSTLLMGPAGSGKSTLAIQYTVAAAERGERSAIFSFDESLHTMLARCEGMGIPLGTHVDSGKIELQQIDPAGVSPGEFADLIFSSVGQDDSGARIVVIDSLNGYLNAMPEEKFMTVQLHELLTYLGQQGAVTLLIAAQHGIVGAQMQAPVDASYLADGVILFRYYEVSGEVCQAISVVKKRGGHHERTIRDFRLTSKGLKLGQPLRELQGVLTGVPWFNPNRPMAPRDE